MVLAVTATLVCVGAVRVIAHEVTFKGTVLTIEAGKTATTGKVKVHIVNDKTKTATDLTFEADDETKVYRGNAVVTFAAAAIQKGEQIAVTVNTDDDDTLAEVIRLAVKK